MLETQHTAFKSTLLWVTLRSHTQCLFSFFNLQYIKVQTPSVNSYAHIFSANGPFNDIIHPSSSYPWQGHGVAVWAGTPWLPPPQTRPPALPGGGVPRRYSKMSWLFLGALSQWASLEQKASDPGRNWFRPVGPGSSSWPKRWNTRTRDSESLSHSAGWKLLWKTHLRWKRIFLTHLIIFTTHNMCTMQQCILGKNEMTMALTIEHEE